MPKAALGSIELHYERQGDGSPLAFISGLGANRGLWNPVVEILRDRYECITFDNRGIGESSRPDSGYTISDLTRDTLGLLDSLSISTSHIIGMSMGGMVAQEIALERPGMVRGLILAGSMAAPDERLMHVLNSRKAMQRQMKPYDYFWALAAWMFGPGALSKQGFAEEFAKRGAENPHPQSLRAFDQLVDGIGQFDVRMRLGEIKAPTLVIVGEQDILTPPHLSRALAEGIPSTEFAVLPGLGHFCATEDPKGFAATVDRFLGVAGGRE